MHHSTYYTKIMQPVPTGVEIEKIFAPARAFPTFGALVSVIIQNAFVLAGVISFVLIIFAGFGVITAAGSGDTKKLEEGKKTMTAAVLGLLVVVGSIWIVQLLATVTGVDIIKQFVGQ